MGCAGALWMFFKLPFTILRAAPQLGQFMRAEAATTSGARVRAATEALTAPDNPAAVAAALAGVSAHDPGFDLAATTHGVIRARAIVSQARQDGDASAARRVLSDGLWRVFGLLLEGYAAHDARRYESSAVAGTAVVSATRDQLAEQLRLRLSCRGERYETAHGAILRGRLGPRAWDEDWIIRRSATATTPPGGGLLSGRCPQCGAALEVSADGSCAFCRALVLSGGHDWVVWSIEEGAW